MQRIQHPYFTEFDMTVAIAFNAMAASDRMSRLADAGCYLDKLIKQGISYINTENALLIAWKSGNQSIAGTFVPYEIIQHIAMQVKPEPVEFTTGITTLYRDADHFKKLVRNLPGIVYEPSISEIRKKMLDYSGK